MSFHQCYILIKYFQLYSEKRDVMIVLTGGVIADRVVFDRYVNSKQ